MPRRLALTTVVSLAVLSAAAPGAMASDGPLPRPLLSLPLLQGADGPTRPTHLTVVVSGSGDPAADGSYELECEPHGRQPPRGAAGLRAAGAAARREHGPVRPGLPGRDVHAAVRRSGHRPDHR